MGCMFGAKINVNQDNVLSNLTKIYLNMQIKNCLLLLHF